ncbi:protein mono-ADP-ribosyltransferase PARP9 [Pygocentrus nattereri]|uniref:protein mono-ADP-ribosyltransferase PARP9 n=1 Tax=Pygocentrus nattereri TaxID=42514 RepID=UPI0008143E8F|nr:protein mono-ADP-ribosyltransferase PARP9 [Pygocentrus nattereri]XP_017550571.1 protein mono-ADP-ribosyltransferase PARP9 [Pygocentrus nattereri]
MTSTECIPFTVESTKILEQSHVAFCSALNGKFGCAAVFHNVEFTTTSSSGSNKGTVMPEIKYSRHLSGGLKISVWKDDLVTHKADAVVNAANEHLNHGGGLALALCRAGGPQIQQASDQIIKVQGRVATGGAVVTPAGNLPCKYIIHAVGPYVHLNPLKSDIAAASPLLDKAIQSIFRCTEFHNLQSVAIPAISSGLYNFPRDLCADIIVNAVKSLSYVRNPQAISLEIRLVNNDDPSVQEMLRACKEILGPSDSFSGAVQIQSTSSATSAWPSLELGNVTLYLKRGPIEEETTDVIVNTIAHDLDLSKGFVSKAISEKAGWKIQDEIRKRNKWNSVADGYVGETEAYNLNCRAVYHTVCAVKSRSSSASQILHKVVTRCLKMAMNTFSSISFPAIGTGNLGFQKEEVAQLMIGAAEQFAKQHKGKKLDVYFVIFPKDTDIYKAFENKMDSIKTQSASKMFSSTTGKGSAFYNSEKASETPYIELFADSSEALREAKAWATRILHKPEDITINNNHVIRFGQEDHEKLMSIQTKFNVLITEFFRNGKCGITINGERTDVSSAALEVEAMLLKAQEDFANAEENELLRSVVCWQAFPGSEEPEINAALEKTYLTGVDSKVFSVNGRDIKIDFRRMQMDTEFGGASIQRINIFTLYSTLPPLKSKSYYARTPIEEKSYDWTERKRKLQKSGLKIVKVEKMENNALKQVFELNEKRVLKFQQLYQCVTAQFCELICRVGFQREYAPPEEQKYGAGIYFTTEVETALKLWKDYEEEYIYIIEARVLTGQSTAGSPQFIVPPPTKDDPLVLYDSVTDANKDIFVIFNGQQALPEFLITCKNPTTSV